jgi:hypothetical protein
MKFLITALLISLVLIGCSKTNDEHIFTLYSSYQNNRLHVATFDAAPNSWDDKKMDEQFKKWFTEDNFKDCNKVAELLKTDWENTVKTDDIKYWCEKGRYRK